LEKQERIVPDIIPGPRDNRGEQRDPEWMGEKTPRKAIVVGGRENRRRREDLAKCA